MSDFLSDTSGATAIEYAIAAAFLALVVITAFSFLGDNLVTAFGEVAGSFNPHGSIQVVEVFKR